MKVGLFTETFLPIVDGVGRVVLSYAETLTKKGHQVTVSSPMYDMGYRGGLPYELIDYYALKVPSAPQYRTGAAVLDAHYLRRMAQAEMDIVHVHSPFSAGSEGLRVARERHLPIVATFHSKYYDDFYKATQNDMLSKLAVNAIVAFYNRCDEVWAVSEASAEVLREYGYKKKPIYIAPNGVTARSLCPEALDRLDEKYALNGLPMLLFVGQINWKKNILRVLEAARALKQDGLQFRLLLAGQGPDKEAVQQKIDELQLSDTATLIGHVTSTEELDALYARASLFTFPSLYDNAPMVVREAAVMGTPAVLVRGSSAAEIVHDGHNGFLCTDDSDHLFRVLKEALASPEKTKAIGINARQTIPVPWDDVMDQVLERYQYHIDHPRPRRFLQRKKMMDKK